MNTNSCISIYMRWIIKCNRIFVCFCIESGFDLRKLDDWSRKSRYLNALVQIDLHLKTSKCLRLQLMLFSLFRHFENLIRDGNCLNSEQGYSICSNSSKEPLYLQAFSLIRTMKCREILKQKVEQLVVSMLLLRNLKMLTHWNLNRGPIYLELC